MKSYIAYLLATTLLVGTLTTQGLELALESESEKEGVDFTGWPLDDLTEAEKEAGCTTWTDVADYKCGKWKGKDEDGYDFFIKRWHYRKNCGVD